MFNLRWLRSLEAEAGGVPLAPPHLGALQLRGRDASASRSVSTSDLARAPEVTRGGGGHAAVGPVAQRGHALVQAVAQVAQAGPEPVDAGPPKGTEVGARQVGPAAELVRREAPDGGPVGPQLVLNVPPCGQRELVDARPHGVPRSAREGAEVGQLGRRPPGGGGGGGGVDPAAEARADCLDRLIKNRSVSSSEHAALSLLEVYLSACLSVSYLRHILSSSLSLSLSFSIVLLVFRSSHVCFSSYSIFLFSFFLSFFSFNSLFFSFFLVFFKSFSHMLVACIHTLSSFFLTYHTFIIWYLSLFLFFIIVFFSLSFSFCYL